MGYYIKKYIKYILIFVLLNSLIISLQFINPILIKKILGFTQLNKEFYLCIAFILGCIAVSYVIKYINNFISCVFCKNIKNIESKRLYESMFRVEYSLLKDLDTTYYVTRVNDSLNNISDFICKRISNFTVSIFIIAICLIISIKYNLVITALFIALFIVNVLFYKKLNLKLQEMCVVLQGKVSNNFKNIVNVCKNIDFIKQSTNYKNFSNKISDYVDKIEKECNKVNIYAGGVGIILEGIVNIIKISVLIFCIVLYFKKEFLLQDIIFIEMILNIYFNALIELKNTNIGLRDLRASIVFLNDGVFSKNETDDGDEILSSVEKINFDLDGFAYEKGKNIILEKTVFSLEKGDKLALAGRSGVGKSTLLNMILGLYKNKGISINNIPLNKYKLKSLRNKIYVVNQNVSIFPGTLKSNIIVGMEENYNKELLNNICNEGFMQDLIKDVGGIDVELLDAGGNLSGGQKQKINIARMLMYNPELIVFDESTSALDSNSENKLFCDIEKYIKEKTIVKISHRFSSISDMEKVVVLTDSSSGCEVYSSIGEAIESSENFNNLFEGQIKINS